MAADGTGLGNGAARTVVASIYQDYVLDALRNWRRQGRRTALLTLVNIGGSSPRPLGSQMAVSEDGEAVGAITGGCVEQALIFDAIRAISSRRNHVERYGEGSRFKDLVLPCGSAIDIGFDVGLTNQTLDRLLKARTARQEVDYTFEASGVVFTWRYRPQPRLVIIGSGHVVPILAQFAALDEYEVIVYSPDDTTLSRCAAFANCRPLRSPTDIDRGALDANTAVVTLFHDHDYELTVLDAVLRSDAFYLGALGSRRAHGNRLAALQCMGWTYEGLDRLKGPVGLDIGARTPSEIAIAILAEMIQIYRGQARILE